MGEDMSSIFGTCPKCGGKVRAMFEITVVTDGKYLHQFTKKAYADKATEVWGVDWSNSYVHCVNCNWQRLPFHDPGKWQMEIQFLINLLVQLREDYLAFVPEADQDEYFIRQVEQALDKHMAVKGVYVKHE